MLKIKYKTSYCKLNNYKPSKVNKPYINLYVKLTNLCNARCCFCVYKGKDTTTFNYEKFKQIIDIIISQVRLNKISFTGGEPSIKIELLKHCINYIKKVSPDTFVIINTNGFNLEKISTVKGLNSIALSRHHYKDEKHTKIMGSSLVATAERIKKINTSIIHLSCNIIKGYIDSEEEIQKYLNHAATLGIYDVGFVSLMAVNSYSETHSLDFENIKLTSTNIVKNKIWSYKDYCKCANYLFLPKEGQKVVKFYCRFRCGKLNDTTADLIFDGTNLRQGFNGTVLY
jgi:molybdenum cofactor biosynthesis enzyme MoaA